MANMDHVIWSILLAEEHVSRQPPTSNIPDILPWLFQESRVLLVWPFSRLATSHSFCISEMAAIIKLTGITVLPWVFPLIRLFVRLWLEVVDPCLVYDHESSKKALQIRLKHLNIILWHVQYGPFSNEQHLRKEYHYIVPLVHRSVVGRAQNMQIDIIRVNISESSNTRTERDFTDMQHVLVKR